MLLDYKLKIEGAAYSDAMEYGKDDLNVYTYQILKGFDKKHGL